VALTSGTRLGVYEVTGRLGAGGMGEVYRAHDTKLHRDVALKALPEAFAKDPERMARFEREAQVLASLNHPHIAAIYGLEEAGDARAIVMELVDGPTLADRIAQGAVPIDEALPIARQIAEALEAAHELGIIHRDLKPANIKVRPDGTVKVLDFGLAKALEPALGSAGAATLANSPTITSPAAMTGAGVILGTAAYMSPEQARGRPVDRRTDIWAFGCVVFEMLTAERAFQGDDVTDTIVAVVSKGPAWAALPAAAAPVRPLLGRCLRKDPKQRLQAIGDARIQIEDLIAGTTDLQAQPVLPITSRTISALAIAAVAGAVVAGTAATWVFGGADAVPVFSARLEILPRPSEALSVFTADRNLAVSPDGRYVVYRSGNPARLVLRPIDRREGQVLEGTSGARSPFFSPDSRWIAFFDGVALKRVAVAGGPVLTICQSPIPRGASWGDDGHIVFATQDEARGLLRVPADGGDPVELSKPDLAAGERGHWNPSVLPGGRGVLFTIIPANRSDPAHVAVLDSRNGQSRRLVPGAHDPQYFDTGHLVYAAASRLWVVRFDLASLEIVDDPTPVVDDIGVGDNTAYYSVSRQGALVYIPTRSAGTEGSLMWIDRTGRQTALDAPPRAYQAARLSPDGSRAAVTVLDQGRHLHIRDMATGSTLPFATVGDNERPVWSADGNRIIFASDRAGGAMNLYSQAADGTGPVERLSESPYIQSPAWASPDRSGVLGSQISPGTAGDIVWFPLKGPSGVSQPSGAAGTDASPLELLIHTAGIDYSPDVSPDGRFVAYSSNESGRDEVLVKRFVEPFPRVDDGQWRASDEGGMQPAWARDGTELFYVDLSSVLTAVEVRLAGGRPTFGRRTKLFAVPSDAYGPRRYDPAPGGRFLVVRGNQPDDERDVIVVVLNWFEELRQRVPVP